MGSARVEVLLRQMAFKPKADIDGVALTGECARSTLCFWKQVAITYNGIQLMDKKVKTRKSNGHHIKGISHQGLAPTIPQVST